MITNENCYKYKQAVQLIVVLCLIILISASISMENNCDPCVSVYPDITYFIQHNNSIFHGRSEVFWWRTLFKSRWVVHPFLHAKDISRYIAKLSFDCYRNCLHWFIWKHTGIPYVTKIYQNETSIFRYWGILMILDEWKNFSERIGPKITNDEIRYWASYRGQTLSRTGNSVYHSHLLYYDLRPWLPSSLLFLW